MARSTLLMRAADFEDAPSIGYREAALRGRPVAEARDVEVASGLGTTVAVRDSKDPDGPRLAFTAATSGRSYARSRTGSPPERGHTG